VSRHHKPLTAARAVTGTAGLAGALALVVAVAAMLGAGEVGLGALLQSETPLTPTQRAILLDVRLPRVLLAAAIGGALTVAGLVFQALLRNPLADPYVLGISGGASLGGVLALLLGLGGGMLGQVGVPVFAFAGALVALGLIERIATIDGRMSAYTVLLTGAVFNAFSGACIFFIQSVASLEELHAIVFYLMGSVPSLGLRSVGGFALAVLVGTAGLFTMARDYNLLSLGEEGAAQLGVAVERVKRRTFVLGALLVGVSVSVAGLIGFIGLVVPHLMRLLLGPDHRLLLPASFLGGGAFLVLADLVARLVVVPSELPVGVVTAMAGGPFFLYLLRVRGKESSLGWHVG
jgi:iron complex transport system permease protein